MNPGPISSFSLNTREGFEKVFRANYPSLCRYAFSLLADVAEAEEVVQEAMFRIWENRNRIEITSSTQAYLFRAVRNHALNHLRRKKVQRVYSAENTIIHNDPRATTSDRITMAELQRKIREVVSKLPAERQRIFIMSRYEGMKYREIAEELGISQKTVENQLGRALQTLRTELSEYLPFLLLCFSEIFES